jgi:FKBP-type peptidyl-prolyl cis-trans isomerase (trigger factor)
LILLLAIAAIAGGCSKQPSESQIQAAIERCASKVPNFSREIRGNSTPEQRAMIERAIAESEAAAKKGQLKMCEEVVRAACKKDPSACL